MWAWQARRPFAADAALAVVLGLLFSLSASADTAHGTWLLLAGLTAPLAWRRRTPPVAFAAVALVAFAQWLADEPLLLADAALLLALYSVAAHARRERELPAAFAVAEIGALLAALRFTDGGALLPFASASAFVVAAAALGVYVRTRREHIAALLIRAQQLERERDQQAQLATAAERARIARELHDVVAHNLTVMIALADGALLTAEQAPDEAAAAMHDVAATGRTALGEMRRLLGVLREDTDGIAAAPALRPQPGIDQLDALLAQVSSAGLPTRLIRTGTPTPLNPGAQLTIYRIVQEALTNALKHARCPSSAEVRLDWSQDVLTLEVVDDGAQVKPTSSAGNGLAGMRERAAAHGARVEAGPRPLGGWGVRTRLRLDHEAARR